MRFESNFLVQCTLETGRGQRAAIGTYFPLPAFFCFFKANSSKFQLLPFAFFFVLKPVAVSPNYCPLPSLVWTCVCLPSFFAYVHMVFTLFNCTKKMPTLSLSFSYSAFFQFPSSCATDQSCWPCQIVSPVESANPAVLRRSSTCPPSLVWSEVSCVQTSQRFSS